MSSFVILVSYALLANHYLLDSRSRHPVIPISFHILKSMSRYAVTVAHYGHPLLKGAWHYSILLYNQADPTYATAFQAVRKEGDREFYVADPEIITPRSARTFQGELNIGWIPNNESSVADFSSCVRLVGVKNNDSTWNCQHWVADVLTQLNKLGLHIQGFRHADLVTSMASAQ